MNMVKKPPKVQQVDIVLGNNHPEYGGNGSDVGVNDEFPCFPKRTAAPKVNSSPWCNFPTLFYLSDLLEIGILMLLLETGLVLSY